MLARTILLGAATVGVALTGSPAIAQGDRGATAPGTAVATVVDPISVQVERQLFFGEIKEGASEAATVSAEEEPQANGATSAKFRVTGTPDRGFQISVQSRVIAVGEATGEQIPVGDLTVKSRNSGATDWSGRLDVTGSDTVYLGGTLRAPEGAQADRYSAEAMIQVSYN